MESVRLSCRPTGADDFAETKCVICQQITPEKLTITPNGCKRIRAASDIRNDCVSKRMKLMADESNFVYHSGRFRGGAQGARAPPLGKPKHVKGPH